MPPVETVLVVLGTSMWHRDKLRIYSMIESICDNNC